MTARGYTALRPNVMGIPYLLSQGKPLALINSARGYLSAVNSLKENRAAGRFTILGYRDWARRQLMIHLILRIDV